MAQNSSNNSSMVENYEIEKKRILLITQGNQISDYVKQDESVIRYYPLEFHLVDLNSNNIHLHYLPSLVSFSVIYRALCVSNSVYLVGHEPKSYPEVGEFEDNVLFLGSSRYDLVTKSNVCCPAPNPINNVDNFLDRCVTLVDKIYNFGSGLLTPPEVVVDPVGGLSKRIHTPRELVGCQMWSDPLPDYSDPSKPRFLLHLSGGELSSQSIYAFTPGDHDNDNDDSGGNWECVAPDFQGWDWEYAAVVCDNVIYFYAPHFRYLVQAFDLTERKWLKIRWKSKFKRTPGVDRYFDFMLSLGNHIFCFGVSRCRIPGPFKIYFFKFRVERSGETVNFFPLDSHSYQLPDTLRVCMNLLV